MATPPTSPVEQPQRNPLLWLAGCMGAVVVILACVFVGVIGFVPSAREQLLRIVGSSSPVSSSTPPPVSWHRADAAASVPSPYRFQDDFETPGPRWEQSGARVIDSSYELRLDLSASDMYGLYLGSTNVKDVDIKVTAIQVSKLTLVEYGIRFRQVGPDNYLMFSISPTGHYRLIRVNGTQISEIVPWTFDPGINTASGQPNILELQAQGAQIRASVNGKQLLQANDSQEASGQLALGLVTYDRGELTVRFSQLSGNAAGTDLATAFRDAGSTPWSQGDSQMINGGYEIEASPGVQTWQEPLPRGSSKLGVYLLETDLTLLSGDENAAYGIVFGDAGDFNYYSLLIFPDGSLGLFRSAGGTTEALVPATPHPSIKPGPNQTNRLSLNVRGNLMTITINGTELGTLDLGQPVVGTIGPTVSAGAQAARVRFDNFSLTEQTP